MSRGPPGRPNRPHRAASPAPSTPGGFTEGHICVIQGPSTRYAKVSLKGEGWGEGASSEDPAGVLIYLRTAADNDTLIRLNADGKTVSQSHFAILNAARCAPGTPAAPRQERHHDLVTRAARHAAREEKRVGGQLGRPSGARFRVYDRLKRFIEQGRGTLFVSVELERAHQAIYSFPLRETARDTLNRQLRSGMSDEGLAELVTTLHSEERLCQVEHDTTPHEPQIICSLGLSAPDPVGAPLVGARTQRRPDAEG